MSFIQPPLKSILKHSFGIIIAATPQLHAATVMSSNYEVQTNMDGNIDNDSRTGAQGLIESEQTMEFNNNHSGPLRAAATHMAQTDNHAGDGTFSFSAASPFGNANGNVLPQTSSSTKDAINASANATFTVTFELGIGETRQANLWLDYTIEITNGNQNEAAVKWELTAPDMSTIGLVSGSKTLKDVNISQSFNTGEISTILNQPGPYTLTLTAELPDQQFKNTQHSASATLDAVYFEVVAVPEPSSATLLALTIGTGLLRRRR